MRSSRKKSSGKQWKVLIPIGLVVIELFILTYLKYRNQGLSLDFYGITYTGNIINAVMTLVLIAEITILSIRKRSIEVFKGAYYFLSISFLSLLAGGWIYNFHPIQYRYYISGYPINHSLAGIFFLIFQITQIIWISYLWLLLFKVKSLILLRSFANGIFVISLLLIFAVSYSQFLQNLNKQLLGNKKSDIGVLFGAAVISKDKPSVTLKGRIDKAAELYKRGQIQQILTTGGNAPGELSEADVAYKYLVLSGVPKDRIIKENKTVSTAGQIAYIKQRYFPTGISDISVTVITDKYHLNRINEMSKFFKIKLKYAGTDTEFRTQNLIFYKVREGVALLLFWLFGI